MPSIDFKGHHFADALAYQLSTVHEIPVVLARIDCPCCKSASGHLQLYDADGTPLAAVTCCHCFGEGTIPT